MDQHTYRWRPGSQEAVRRLLTVVMLVSLLAACDSITANPTPTPATAVSPTASPVSSPAAGPAVTTPTISIAQARRTPRAARPSSASPAALAYLTYAVDYIEQNALYSDQVDWPAVRAYIFGPEMTAQTPAETYPFIKYVLHQLHDRHSFLITAEAAAQENTAVAAALGLTVSYAQRKVLTVDPGGMAGRAGVRAGDTIVTVNDAPVESLDATEFFARVYLGNHVKLGLRRRDTEIVSAAIGHDTVDFRALPRGRRLDANIGYIAVPPLGASPIWPYYADVMQQIIQDIDQTPTCGWVVDLQGNTGGNMGQMLAGIGPVLGEGPAGSFVGPAGSWRWDYSDGAALIDNEVVAQVDPPYQLQRPNPPVAVLIDRVTASAGESVLVAFRGRPNTQSFGEDTFGVPTANWSLPLSDGAVLWLTQARYADRTGQTYDDKIPPDVSARTNPFWRGTDDDEVLAAGVAWLKQQPACAGP